MVLIGFGLWKVIGRWIDRLMGGQARMPVDRFLRLSLVNGIGMGRRPDRRLHRRARG